MLTCIAVARAQNRSTGGGSDRRSFSLANRYQAQMADTLSTDAPSDSTVSLIGAYRLTELGGRYQAPMDTNRLNTANSTLVEGRGIAIAHTGNIASPAQSRIFAERREGRDFIFADVYDAYIITPQNGLFYDAKIPYTNVLYTRAGTSARMEEQFRTLLTSNFGKRINAGVDFDYIYSRGFYNSNGNKMINYRFFGSYLSDRYEAFAHVRNFNMVNSENGGLTNDRYVTHPDDFENGKRGIDSRSFPTRLTNTWNRVRSRQFFLSHRYNLGFYRRMTSGELERRKQREEEKQRRLAEADEQRDPAGDTSQTTDEEPEEDIHADEVFVPVSSIVHTFEFEDFSRRFISEYPAIDTCYANNYGRAGELPNDTSYAARLRSKLALSVREGFQDWAVFGVSVFAGVENRRFRFGGDSAGMEHHMNDFAAFVGGEIAKQKGSVLTYNASGELYLTGADVGRFGVEGSIQTRFRLLGQVATLRANGFIRNERPAYFLQHYYGRYFQWDRKMQMTQRVRAEGIASVERTRTQLAAGVESIRRYVYFAPEDGLPQQFDGNIQVIHARLRQDFRYKAFGWENELVYQLSGNDAVLPLPQLCVYTNLYASFRLFDVLSVQLGADAHYYTAYYSPGYEPAIQQFVNQREMRTGNFPLLNVYANLHLKQTRFFVAGYNVGSLLADHPAYFLMPHYPMNPMHVKMGLSVMFSN